MLRLHLLVLVVLLVPSAGLHAADGLLAEWRFDESGGDVAQDAAGPGRDAKLYGATRVDPADGKAISLDGMDDYVDGGDSTELGIGGPLSGTDLL